MLTCHKTPSKGEPRHLDDDRIAMNAYLDHETKLRGRRTLLTVCSQVRPNHRVAVTRGLSREVLNDFREHGWNHPPCDRREMVYDASFDREEKRPIWIVTPTVWLTTSGLYFPRSRTHRLPDDTATLDPANRWLAQHVPDESIPSILKLFTPYAA